MTGNIWTTVRRRALPGPWGRRDVVRELAVSLALGALTTLLSAIGSGNPLRLTAVGLAASTLYALRRGLPGVALAGAAALAGALGGFLPLLAVTSWSAGYRITRARTLTAAFLAAFGLNAAASVWHDGDELPATALLGVTVAGYLLVAVLPAVLGRYRAQRRTLLTTLQERNDQLLRERAMIAHQARLRERQRIAQDMHDSLGHQLALIAVHTGALEVDRGLTGPQREGVAVLRQAAVTAMRELREVVGLLREDSEAVEAAGGVDAVERLTDASRAAGTAVELHRSGEVRPLAAATGHAAYRIVQEALTNAHKHAPTAPISVALRFEPDALLVEVVNGPGPSAAPAVSGGQGLTGLRERARLLGGMVHTGPTADGGYRLAGVLPYDGTGRPPADDPDLPDAPPQPSAGLRRSPAIGCAAVVAVVVLAVLGLVVWGGVTFFRSLDHATLPTSVYDSLQVGQSEAEVRGKLPPGSDFLTKGYRDSGPAVPPGASCSWFMSGEQSSEFNSDYVDRLCFRDGVLIEKLHYRAKV
ncbi:hypothetical protein GCM10010193_40870 [Kitasatospora atroaurantiaca]|uniref:histidine kinase n=1 Tax=Kitasatospora atroaurantiaca TaxID=285545 RepID=A0A561F1E8_9ACTN|nr:sensor histidine kinase [Kitasatospora atroaurantiaca]TWE21684.1 signal transduction histidine kinase [Kitasatospora atroaurantiaca]